MAFGAGVLLIIQISMNAQLRLSLKTDGMLVTLLSFISGGLLTALVVLLVKSPLPDFNSLGQVPLWAWFGGLLGALYVGSTIILAPKLGTASLTGAVVAGQMAAALLVDHYGLMGNAVRVVSWERLGGVGLILLGVWLVQKK